MRQILAAAAMTMLVHLTGCTYGPGGPDALGAASGPVGACMNALGGLDRWRGLRSVRAEAVVSTYDESGEAMVNTQKQVINVAGGSIRAEAQRPAGGWSAGVGLTGSPSFSADGGAVSGKLQALLTSGLRTTLHRVRGPLNLYQGTERATGASAVRVSGVNYVRVPVTGSPVGVRAYYFDAETHLPRMVTAGGDAPGEEGTVTITTYKMQPNGVLFPVTIDVRRIGQHALVGEEKVLEVRYLNVRF